MAQAQAQAAGKLHAACDECREYLRLGSRLPYRGSSVGRNTKVEVLRRRAKLRPLCEREDGLCIFASEADGTTKKEKAGR
jgi:hypothetical protein